MMKKNFLLLFFLSSPLFLNSCASSTESGAVGADRRQFFAGSLVSSEHINSISADSYDQLKRESEEKKTLNRDAVMTKRVKGIAQRLRPFTQIFRREAPGWAWEANVITADELNAFCMPGGKIMFYSGIIEKLQLTDAEIAAVMGHEIAHALREHGRERMSEALVKQGLAQILLLSGKVEKKYIGLALFASNFLDLKFSRDQESEADVIGLELMARAGYDPDEAIHLWEKMGSQGGSKPPEILSTHPASRTRIKNIESYLPKVRPLYQATLRSAAK